MHPFISAGWLAAVLACRLLTHGAHLFTMSLTYTTTNIQLCAATDVGMHGLLASQS